MFVQSAASLAVRLVAALLRTVGHAQLMHTHGIRAALLTLAQTPLDSGRGSSAIIAEAQALLDRIAGTRHRSDSLTDACHALFTAGPRELSLMCVSRVATDADAADHADLVEQ
jgi:hypothetical protein